MGRKEEDAALARALLAGEVVADLGSDWSVRSLADVARELGWSEDKTVERIRALDPSTEALGAEKSARGWRTYARLTGPLAGLVD